VNIAGTSGGRFTSWVESLSHAVGCPLTIRDEDIDVAFPSGEFQGVSSQGLVFHSKLAELAAKVMTGKPASSFMGYLMLNTAAAYSYNGSINTAYIMGIQNFFSHMAEVADSFVGDFQLNLGNPETGVARESATLHLAYFQARTTLSVSP
jgi:hypothetical protein